jgi:hypothetical protein
VDIVPLNVFVYKYWQDVGGVKAVEIVWVGGGSVALITPACGVCAVPGWLVVSESPGGCTYVTFPSSNVVEIAVAMQDRSPGAMFVWVG